ncbi:hypothetical protein B0H12DRAFT_1328125 [Mycena haematopus]|nr:hypothetical protein B0H12DRAFT_1328125 [Mycena haematopus]
MSDPSRCRGSDADGQQCICIRADSTYVGEDKRTRCVDCDHIASAHPQAKPTIGSFVRGFRDAAKADHSSSSSQSAKTSREEAAAEMSAGLRNTKKRKPDSNSESALKKSKKSKSSKEKSAQTEYGKAVMLTCGITDDGQLLNARIPSIQDLQEMKKAKLVVLSSPAKPLVINASWTNEQANEEVASLFPEAIKFLSQEHPGETQLWLGVTAHKNAVTLAGDPLPTGVELADYCRIPGRPSRDRVLYLVSKFKIARRHWEWHEADPDSEDLGSDIDTVASEDIVFTPKPKPAYKGKGKGKATDVKTELEADQTLDKEEESDMRNAAKKRTRLATGVIKKKTIFIPSSDDAEQDVVVVSDDEDQKLQQVAFTALHPLTPNDTGFYANFSHSLPPAPMESPFAFSSSSTSVPPTFGATVSTWTPAFTSATSGTFPPMPLITTGSLPPPLITPDVGIESSHLPAPNPQAVAGSGHRFKKMGRGR